MDYLIAFLADDFREMERLEQQRRMEELEELKRKVFIHRIF